jgi:hypothetical protein
MGALLAVMIVGGVVSRAAMAAARGRLRAHGLLERLQVEDPTPETVSALMRLGAPSGPFRLAYAAYRIGTAAQVAFYGLGVLVDVGALGAGLAYVLARGDVIGPHGVDWPLAVGGPVVIAYFFTLLGTQAARALSVWRRSGRFPEGLAYAHLVSRRMRSDWRRVPPPRTDIFADLYEGWSVTLERTSVRLAPPMVFFWLLAGVFRVLGRI